VAHQHKASPWSQAWLRNDGLETLNRRIHGTVPVDRLYEDALTLQRTAIHLWPSALPKEGARILDVGSGVGWPMQAALDTFPGSHVTGLDISEPMVQRAKQRLIELPNFEDYEGRYDFTVYGGVTFPFPDNTFDFVYCYRVLWHVPEHYLFPILHEITRVIRLDGSVILQFLPLEGIRREQVLAEYENQRKKRDVHYHYYYTYQKIYWWISELLDCRGFDICQCGGVIWVHFRKTRGSRVRNAKFARLLGRLNKIVKVHDPNQSIWQRALLNSLPLTWRTTIKHFAKYTLRLSSRR
jgi:ubiquinone/menaquinone biosynthesis C-methylase UbiE